MVKLLKDVGGTIHFWNELNKMLPHPGADDINEWTEDGEVKKANFINAKSGQN